MKSKLLAGVLVPVSLALAGCPSTEPEPAAGICGMRLDQARGVRLEESEDFPVIRVVDFPAAFMLANKLSSGDKTCVFDLVGQEVRRERVFFRQGKLTGINHGKIEEAEPGRVRISYFVKSQSYGLVLVEPVTRAPDDSDNFEWGGLNFEVQGGAFMRLEQSLPLVRSLGPETRILIHNRGKKSLLVQLLVDNTSERLSRPKLQNLDKPKIERIRPLVLRLSGTLGPGRQAIVELVPRELKRPFSFIFGGDIKQEVPVYKRLLRVVRDRSDPLFMLAIGDYTRNCLPWEYETYFQVMQGVPFPVYYVKGNHETHCQGDVHYRRLFAPDRFNFRVADLLFVVLDSNLPSDTGYRLGEQQLAWLDGVLDEHAGIPWKMVTLHIPPHPIHGSPPDKPYLYNLDPKDSRALMELAEKHHVSHVLTGHAHLFARKVENGVVYLTSGGAGASLYNYNALPGFTFSLKNHLMVLNVYEDSIEEERIDLSAQSR